MRACSTTEEGVFGEALFTSVRSVTLKVLFVVPKGGVTTEVQCQRELLGKVGKTHHGALAFLFAHDDTFYEWDGT